jgi:hypothetical protein
VVAQSSNAAMTVLISGLREERHDRAIEPGRLMDVRDVRCGGVDIPFRGRAEV